jgi:HPt (histidine-containing phosphotransfer) domain-containing protein
MAAKESEGVSVEVDHATLAALRREDEGLFEELIGLFGVEAPQRLDALARAIAAGDCKAAALAAHALKGIVVTFGAKGLADECVRLEQTARGGSLEGAGAALERLRAGCARLAGLLEAERSKATP